MHILIVDDDEGYRIVLHKILSYLGYEVSQASDGAEAWSVLQNSEINLVISDWMMPKIDGIELCRKVRSEIDRYVYIILMSAKDTKSDLIEGLEAGADDFLNKPFSKEELDVKIRAGNRIIKLENDFIEKNNILSETNKKLNKAYETIRQDLELAAKIQRDLLPSTTTKLTNLNSSWMFIPSGFVAGDIFNYHWLDKDNLSFFILDVVGHGVPAALLSVTVSKVLTMPSSDGGTMNLANTVSIYPEVVSPSEIVKNLNDRFQSVGDEIQYFTMVYGVINVTSGKVKLTQAGHPHPIYLPKNGDASLIGKGGYAVGMFPDVEYEEVTLTLRSGDRLFLYSDGITECFNKDMEPFSQGHLIKELEAGKDMPLKEVVRALDKKLHLWKNNKKFDDDLTLLAFEMH